MSLHARSVAAAAGAREDEAELVAQTLCAKSAISAQAAKALLAELRSVRAESARRVVGAAPLLDASRPA